MASFLPRLCDEVGESAAGKLAYRVAGEMTLLLMFYPLCSYTYNFVVSGARDLDNKYTTLTNAINALCGELSKSSKSILDDIVRFESLATTVSGGCRSLQQAQLTLRDELKTYFKRTIWWILEKIGLYVGGSVTTLTGVATVADTVTDRKESYRMEVWRRILNAHHDIVCAFAAMWESFYNSLYLAKTVCAEPEELLPSLEGGYGNKLRL